MTDIFYEEAQIWQNRFLCNFPPVIFLFISPSPIIVFCIIYSAAFFPFCSVHYVVPLTAIGNFEGVVVCKEYLPLEFPSTVLTSNSMPGYKKKNESENETGKRTVSERQKDWKCFFCQIQGIGQGLNLAVPGVPTWQFLVYLPDKVMPGHHASCTLARGRHGSKLTLATPHLAGTGIASNEDHRNEMQALLYAQEVVTHFM